MPQDLADTFVMDPLVSGVLSLNQAAATSKIQYAVAKKLLDSQRADGAAVLRLLDAAANGPARAGDALVAAATGLGGHVDVAA